MSPKRRYGSPGVDAEIIDVRTLAPLDVDTLVHFGLQDRPVCRRA